jgi:hypothetical protein
MNLNNINLFPEPDPYLIPPPPPNPDVMQAVNNASMGMEPIPPLTEGQLEWPSPSFINEGVLHDSKPNYDAPAYRTDLLKPDPIIKPKSDFESVQHSFQNTFPHINDEMKVADVSGNQELYTGKGNYTLYPDEPDPLISPKGSMGGHPINNMKPVPPPRPVTGINGYGTTGVLPKEAKAGSLFSSVLEREEGIAASKDAMQTKAHAKVEDSYMRGIEQGRQRNDRNAQKIAQREFDEMGQSPKPTPGTNLPKEQKTCPRCDTLQIDLSWKMCTPCMQRLLIQIEKKVGLEEEA